jgi:hypothetical protein
MIRKGFTGNNDAQMSPVNQNYHTRLYSNVDHENFRLRHGGDSIYSFRLNPQKRTVGFKCSHF